MTGGVTAGWSDGLMVADDSWRSPDTAALFDAILRLETRGEAERFFRDLCTIGELRDMAHRWAVVRFLAAGFHYTKISQLTGASTATITRIASWLNHGDGGYRLMLERARDQLPAPPAGLKGRQ